MTRGGRCHPAARRRPQDPLLKPQARSVGGGTLRLHGGGTITVRWRLSFMRRAILLLLLVLSVDAREVARVPARIANNRILLSVAVNEHPPSTFILDTGAARSVVEKEYADDRGIRATGMTH